MCGIAGFVDFGGLHASDALERVRRMTDTIAHRGPDGEGHFVDGHAALGHRRLAIIDVAAGQQPMSVLDGAVQIVFNGEIYNFPEIRRDLEGLGHAFRTHSDTEVILHAYLEWGRACVDRLNGMFAFAIWDARERKLWLARDRTGEKPLYYTSHRSGFAFASEIKALRAGGLCGDDVDPEALDCYLSLGYVPAPRSIYSSVRKLRAAHELEVTATRQSERRYWHLHRAGRFEGTLEEAAEAFEALFERTIRSRLMSEVPLGAFLSAGIDSSLVVAAMSQASMRPVITHSIGFDDRALSELPAAQRIAQALGTDHHEFSVTPNAAEALDRIAWHFDEPLGDPSALPTWYVCEAARRSVTVALSGDGGDEGFGGYTFRYLPHLLESRVRAAVPVSIRGPLFGALGALWSGSARLPRPLRLKTVLENLAVGDPDAFYRDLAWLRADTREALYTPGFLQSLRGFTPMEAVRPYYVENDAEDALGRSQYADLQLYMSDDVLAKVDRMSMAHSLEVRAPFLDHRVLEFAATLPRRFKLRGRKGKVLLRHVAARKLPSGIANLPKRGFSIPAARWLRGELKAIVESLLFAKQGLIASALHRSAIERVWSEHQSGARDHHVLLWNLTMLGHWDRHYGAGADVGP